VTISADRRLKKAALKMSYLREELYDLEEEFDRRGWELQRAVIELLARAGELEQRASAAQAAPRNEAESAPEKGDESPAPAWQKKLFRKITSKTHPDALLRQELSEREIIERSKMFMDSRAALEKQDGGRLLEIAAELDIDVEDAPVEEHLASMERLANELEARMSQIKSTAAWVWGEGKKREILNHVARVSGWSGKDPELVDAVVEWVNSGFTGGVATYSPPPPQSRSIRPNRKVGERPPKMIRR
jgi:hypothetical protein